MRVQFLGTSWNISFFLNSCWFEVLTVSFVNQCLDVSRNWNKLSMVIRAVRGVYHCGSQ